MAYSFTWLGTAHDSKVLSFELSHAEGDFALLTIDIPNPLDGTGLLAAGLTGTLVRDGTTIFVGRLVGWPEDMAGDVMRLQFRARPETFDADKAALAATLKVAPYYDPVFIRPEELANPDTVLEGRTALWHVDRVTNAVTVSDIIAGEAGTLVVGSGTAIFESVRTAILGVPATTIDVKATVQWDQASAGTVDIADKIGVVKSYTGSGLLEDWPEAGASIGSGWEVGKTLPRRLDGKSYQSKVYGVDLADSVAGFPLWRIESRPFEVRYEVSRDRTETVTFTVNLDVQPLASETQADGRMNLDTSSDSIARPVDPGGALPIGDVRRSSYFLTARGVQSVEHLIVLARARLLARARAVAVTWDMPLATAIGLSCRHSATLNDDRLPGGSATGKVTAYRFAFNGDSGVEIASVTIACTIGTGASVSAVAPTGAYAAAGYAEPGWQAYQPGSGGWEITTGDLTYSDYSSTAIDDDGVNLLNMTADHAVLSCVVVNGHEEHEAAFDDGSPFADFAGAAAAVNDVHTKIALALRPLEHEPFHTDFALTVSALVAPKTIDLEAA